MLPLIFMGVEMLLLDNSVLKMYVEYTIRHIKSFNCFILVIYFIITPYIIILDFDWLIAGAFFVYFHIKH